jgi:hypothetical protein
MGLDHDGVARHQRREQARVGVPGREGVAADDHGDPAPDDVVVLVHDQRLTAARLLPAHRRRDAQLLGQTGRDGLEGPVLGVRTAGLEGHHERLTAGVHDGGGDLERPCVDPVDDLQRDGGADLGTDRAPGRHRRLGRGQQLLDVDLGVPHAQGRAVGRDLLADPAARRTAAVSGLSAEGVVGPGQVGVEGPAAVVGGRLAVDPGRWGLGIAGVEAAAHQGRHGLGQGLAVLVEQVLGDRSGGLGRAGCHVASLPKCWLLRLQRDYLRAGSRCDSLTPHPRSGERPTKGP